MNPGKHFFGILPSTAPAESIQNYYGKLCVWLYLTDIVARRMTRSNKIGFVTAQPIPSVISTVNVVWSLCWFDPLAEKQAAVTLVEAVTTTPPNSGTEARQRRVPPRRAPTPSAPKPT